MSLEETLAANTAALTRNSDLLERVIAGQEAAMAKLAEGGGKPATSRRKPKDEPAADEGNAAAASTESGDTAAASATNDAPVIAPTVAGITDADTMKAYVSGWTGGTEDQAERAKRVETLKAIAAELGVETKFAALLPHKDKVVFYIERAKAGKAIDFKADYDFAGDPAQGGDAPATTSDDDFG